MQSVDLLEPLDENPPELRQTDVVLRLAFSDTDLKVNSNDSFHIGKNLIRVRYKLDQGQVRSTSNKRSLLILPSELDSHAETSTEDPGHIGNQLKTAPKTNVSGLLSEEQPLASLLQLSSTFNGKNGDSSPDKSMTPMPAYIERRRQIEQSRKSNKTQTIPVSTVSTGSNRSQVTLPNPSANSMEKSPSNGQKTRRKERRHHRRNRNNKKHLSGNERAINLTELRAVLKKFLPTVELDDLSAIDEEFENIEAFAAFSPTEREKTIEKILQAVEAAHGKNPSERKQ
ncbi:hypothetical protein AB6A40_006139 [Gnathostoma spinigerum]|uniref:Uncharacterized protein n=1 Tax=Gnathostoma spinigerum TaxID=75299 RepID=A0ABD6EHH3_9BILA